MLLSRYPHLPVNTKMLYKSNQDLPADVRDRLSEAAQELYRAAFNCAIHWYGEESKAHQVAWCAVRTQAANIYNTLDQGSSPLVA